MPNSKALIAGLLALATILATTACDQAKRYSDQEHVQKAKDFQDQGKLEAAVIELKNALQQNPKNSEARWRLGQIYVDMGLGEAAEDELQRAKEPGVDYEVLKVPMGQALILQGLYKRVLSEIQPGPKSPPENIPKILELRGRAQLGLFQIAEGCKLFAESLEKDPKYIPGYWGLAQCAAVRGNLDEARTDLNKAIALDEKNALSWTHLGDLERSTRRLPEAEAAYATALKYESNDVDALLGRGAVRIESNHFAEASEDIDAAFKLSGSSLGATQLRGVIQFRQGHYDAAKASFETVLKRSPNYLAAVLWLGVTNFWQGDYEQAARRFVQYTRDVPNATQVQALLALAQAKLGHGQDAQEALKALGNIDIKDPASLATLAQAHLYFGQVDLAAAYLTKAVQQKPEAADLRVDLATTLVQKGDRTKAIAQLEDAIRLDPSLVRADELLIQNLIREKRFDEALSAVEVLEKKRPNDPTTFNLKGTVYVAKNDLINARKSFEQALALEKNSIDATMNLAQLDLLEKNPEAARQRFKAILDKDQNNVQAMMGLAAVAAASGQETEYVAWLEKATQAGRSAVRPRMLLASYYLQKNDFRRALVLAQEAQDLSPGDVDALDLLGAAQLAAGETQHAVTTYSKLARRVPNNPVAYFRLATAQMAAQSMDAAASLNQALALKPDYLPAELLLASAEMHEREYGEALRIAQRIQAQQPSSADGWVLQGDILMAQKKSAPALRAYDKALALNKNGAIAVKVHQALSADGKTKEADARLLQWLSDRPSDVAARAYLAATYLQTGRNKRAIEQYQLLSETDPKNIFALDALAWLYQQEQDPRALATAEQAYQLMPNSPDIVDTLGWILVGESKTARGLELLEKAAEMAPLSTEIRYHLAVALAKSGDNGRARQELQDLLAKNKKFPQRQDAQALLRQLSG